MPYNGACEGWGRRGVPRGRGVRSCVRDEVPRGAVVSPGEAGAMRL